MAKIIDPRRHTWCDTPVDDVGVLIDADEYYPEFYRVACKARRYLLLAGWQFDSDVALLRGGREAQVESPITLLKFLNHLCEVNPELQIYILAWDFHLVFALEREWLQQLVFEWTNHRLHFLFDSSHVERASHHQKFVVVDGELSFLGGLDLCDHRWDDRSHTNKNPHRVSRGEPHKPFHDVQAYVRGREVARALTDIFTDRWRRAGGAPLTLPDLEGLEPTFASYRPEGGIPLATKHVTLSRTDPHGAPNGALHCTEIRDLFVDAIDAAERFIYIETQYFSSHVIADAIERRMRAEGRPLLDVVLMLNMEAETMKEQIAVGLSQAKVLGQLRKAAAETGHYLGTYYTLPACGEDEKAERATYIHSKVMIVDDRFLTLGSANLTNRSLSIDTEINVSVEAADPDDPLGRSIRRVRASLIGEHLGGPDFEHAGDLVAQLDAQASPPSGPRTPGSSCRLRLHPSPTDDERALLEVIDPQALPFDPAAAEDIDQRHGSLFVGGLGALWRHLFSSRTAEK
ncbi:phospholipase [Sorangium cellulosum]|uniref:Phospholipase n=1 Tax=Sorangium cellulosum TaxID=56 RepID=A0A2L0F1E3_SORCE|nr:phospholipase D-like domain-containing protein [Sorangium cellulosum]AUX45353.1 phospholipase [Sorangium cellulosum]